MKCHSCGTENQQGDKFCIKCGTHLVTHAHQQNHSDAQAHTEDQEESLKCPHCGEEAQKDDKFCLNCGKELTHHTSHVSSTAHYSHEANLPTTLPAEHAEKIINDAQNLVKHLNKEEKIMGGASLIALIAFFMPWSYGATNGFSFATSNGWYFLFVLLIIVSLIVTYFTQGAKKNAKIFHTTIQASIGAYLFGSSVNIAGFYAQLGLLLTILASATLFGTAIYYQRKLNQ